MFCSNTVLPVRGGAPITLLDTTGLVHEAWLRLAGNEGTPVHDRGFFLESYQAKRYAAAGIHDEFIQDNQSRSSQGVLRGLHYQIEPRAQGKLIRVIVGAVFDVVVDIE